MGKTSLEVVDVLPGSIFGCQTTPVNQNLGDRCHAVLTNPLLQDGDWNLVRNVKNGKSRGYLLPWADAWFELGHMEHWVHPAGRRLLQFISYLANALADTVGFVELERKLMVCPTSDRRLNVGL
jgi:hypothetical protein